MTDILHRISAADFASRAAVADVVEEWDDVKLIADGRAPSLVEWNHAALWRAGSDGADALLAKIAAFFHKRNRRASILLDSGATPADLPERLSRLGWSRAPGLGRETMLWNPDAPHIFTTPRVYMTLATNATLNGWLDILTEDLRETVRTETYTMETVRFRAPQTWFWFGLYDGLPVGVCSCSIHEGTAAVGRIQVAARMRGKGVGLALLNFVTRQSRKDGADVTFLYNDTGGPATGLARTAGYSTVAEDTPTVWSIAPPTS